METGKVRWWGAVVFGEEEGEEARQLHDAGGGQHSEEQHDGRGGQRQQLASGGRWWPKKIRSIGRMSGWGEQLIGLVKKIWLRVWDMLERK
jgi:hypothetical protein